MGRARDYESSCLGKEAFRHVRLAANIAKKRAGVGVYFCRYCGHYHIGRDGEGAPALTNRTRRYWSLEDYKQWLTDAQRAIVEE